MASSSSPPLAVDPSAPPRRLLALGAEIARRVACPDASPDQALALFDELPPPPAAPRGEGPSPRALENLSAHFRGLGFKGNDEDYYAPENSFIPWVLRKRRGIPITLALVYMALGERAGLEIRGVSAPGHFLCRCDVPGGPAFIDVYAGGRLMDEAETLDFLGKIAPALGAAASPLSLLPAGNLEIARRLLSNLRGIYLDLRDLETMERVLAAMTELTPGDPDLWVERGAALAAMGRRREAAACATRSVLAGGGSDAASLDIRRSHLISMLGERMSSTN